MELKLLAEKFKERDVTSFAHEILGMPTHFGQEMWFTYAWKPIDILKPANQWGKTTAEAIFHIYHAVTKPMLDRFNMKFEDKIRFRYLTLNFGKTYEVARGVEEAILDIVEGRYLLPDGSYNKSLLKGWAITDIWDQPRLPKIKWWNNSETLIRSYDGLGESFKRLRLAFVSGDECGDIPELRLFLNGTLLPRLFYFQGQCHLIGTPQPEGQEYEDLAAEAEDDFLNNGLDSDYFVISYNTDPSMAEVFQNKFMPVEHLKRIQMIADPELKKQIIQGRYVDWQKHLYTWDEVNQMFIDDIPYNVETGISKVPEKDAYYIFSVDMAASDDETSETCIRYRIKKDLGDGKSEELPHEIVFHRAWKGSTYPLSLQYEIIKKDYAIYKQKSPARTNFIYDAGSLGGKNAAEAFKDLHGYPFPPKGRSYAEIKAEGFGKVKEVLSRGREFIVNEKGETVDKNPKWGGIKASSKLTELKRQLEIASRDDDKIKNDQFTTLMQAVHFIEMRAPRTAHTRAVSFDLVRSSSR